MGTAGVTTKHPLTGEWVVSYNYNHIFEAKCREMTTEEVSPFTPEESTEETNSGKGPEANAWVRQGPARFATEGYENPGKNIYLALERNFMHWHQPQQRASVPVQRVSMSSSPS